MYILNIRQGFATNSSSSHSLIYIPNNSDLSKIHDEPIESPSFGWSEFILKSPYEKKKYFASLLCSSIRGILPPRIINLIIKDLININEDINVENDSWYVDHQSAYDIPLTKELTDINIEFVKDFYNYIMNKNIVIIGGNDNGGRDAEEILPKGIKFEYADISGFKDTYGTLIAKKQNNNVWTLFNYSTGSKVAISFDMKKNIIFDKSRTPDLVDLKITDYCNSMCPYCYQDSTLNGKHAKYDDIINIIDALAELDVLEIAFGGGDTTSHPHFEDIIKYTREKNIVPNFSTRSINWVRSYKLMNAVDKYIGAVGFSISSMKEVEDIHILLDKYLKNFNDNKLFHNRRNRIFMHYVMGSTPIDELDNILEAINDYSYGVLLLGYKNVGRGKDFKPYDYSDWINLIKNKYIYSTIGIDTSLAKEYKNELKKIKVCDKTYYTEEGKFSMYIDAVNMKMGPSSYCSPEEMFKLPCNLHHNIIGCALNDIIEEIEKQFNAY